MPLLLTSLIALAAFAAGFLAGRARRPRPPADAAAAAENADLRRRMDELADALLAAADRAQSTPSPRPEGPRRPAEP